VTGRGDCRADRGARRPGHRRPSDAGSPATTLRPSRSTAARSIRARCSSPSAATASTATRMSRRAGPRRRRRAWCPSHPSMRQAARSCW
jgi:hypothetical protein